MTPDTMRAAILRAPLDLKCETTPVPGISDGEILVRVRAALTCGTDRKAYMRGHPKIKIPGPLGHEFSGDIAAVGLGVETFRVGDRVACVHTAPCMDCYFCGKSQYNLCETLTDRMAYGAYAEYIRIPAHVVRTNCMAMPPGLSYEAAALTEPLACCVYGMKCVAPIKDETALIIGDGPIGLMMVSLASIRGASRIGVAGKNPARLRVAESLGASVTFAADSIAAELLAHFPPRGPDIVIECVGTAESWRQSIDLVRPGGRVLWFGGCPPGAAIPVDGTKIHYGDLTVRSAFHFTPREVREAFDLIVSGAIPADRLISARAPLSDVPKYFEPSAARDHIKVAFIL